MALLFALIALLAGAQLPLAFAPFNLSSCAFIGPALLVITWLYATNKQAMLRGWLFGLGFFGVGASWVYISIHTFGHAPIAIALLITTLFIAVLALFPALHGYLLTKFFKKNSFLKIVIIFPLTWVLFEWLRSWVLTGFPWLFLGYTQLATPLRNLAPIGSVYLISFAVVITAALTIYLLIKRTLKATTISIILLILLWSGSALLGKITWTKPAGKAISVALVQGNIPLTEKWNSSSVINILRSYLTLTEHNWNHKLIIWPEAAIPLFPQQIKPFITNLSKEAKLRKVTIISGIPTLDSQDHYYNSMLNLSTGATYQKRRLVPFGEYLPLKPLTQWLLNYLKIPMSSFSSGNAKQPAFTAAGIVSAPAICYEIAYPTLILNDFPQAQLIITITDDTWFGHSIAAAQHLQMAQMRSLETGRYQLVATNTGITAIINPKGAIVARAPCFTRTVLTGTIYPMQGTTPCLSLWGETESGRVNERPL